VSSHGQPDHSGADQRASRRALTRIAQRAGRFLGVSDLQRAIDETHRELDKSNAATAELIDTLRNRVQMLEEEQLRTQQARAVWVTNTYLAAADIPERALISVVLPTRNRATRLRRAIGSVVAQSYGKWELVVVDDGSDDDTSAVLEQLRDPRIIVLHQDHRGLAAARNAGIDKASGDYVVYLDDDNLMNEHWLRGVAWAFTVHPDAHVMIGARLIDDEFRGRQERGGGPPHLSFISWLDRAALREGNQADVMQLAHRRDLDERFDHEDHPYEDWGFLARATRNRDPLCFPALAGIYTTTAPDRLMDSDRTVLDQQVRRIQGKLA
jgi:Glycosyl transferase family 2